MVRALCCAGPTPYSVEAVGVSVNTVVLLRKMSAMALIQIRWLSANYQFKLTIADVFPQAKHFFASNSTPSRIRKKQARASLCASALLAMAALVRDRLRSKNR